MGVHHACCHRFNFFYRKHAPPPLLPRSNKHVVFPLSILALSKAQAYVSDFTDRGTISVELGKFQGVAVGMAFMFGIPISSILSKKMGLRFVITLY